jgi:hypothetical protein
MMLTPASADGIVAFHLDFSSFNDVSGNNLETIVGGAVQLVPEGGPTLGDGRTLNSAFWEGIEDEENQIVIVDNPLLDAITITPGSIVTWINPLDGDEWNNIAKTPCPDNVEPCEAFSQFIGIEFQASGPHAGVFGAAQGWDTNVFSPESPPPFGGGDGTSDTPTGEWTHAALVWNAQGDHTIFVNGEPGETVIGVGDEGFGQNMPGDWTIGGDGLGAAGPNPDATRYLRGQLADFAIFAGALTQAEIQDIIEFGVPTTGVNGDFNGDGVFDTADIDLLGKEIIAGTNNLDFDMNDDGAVNLADQDEWRGVAAMENGFAEPYLNGDADLDGSVVAGDLNAVGTNWQTSPDPWSSGDFDADGFVGVSDLNLLGLNWQKSISAGGATAVPEPSAITLALLSLLGFAGNFCRRP